MQEFGSECVKNTYLFCYFSLFNGAADLDAIWKEVIYILQLTHMFNID